MWATDRGQIKGICGDRVKSPGDLRRLAHEKCLKFTGRKVAIFVVLGIEVHDWIVSVGLNDHCKFPRGSNDCSNSLTRVGHVVKKVLGNNGINSACSERWAGSVSYPEGDVWLIRPMR
jgi:hypothetical protein